MSTSDKAAHKLEDLKGRGKEAAGRAIDNKDLEVEGKTDQAKAAVNEVGEKVKDAAERAKRVVQP